MSTFIDLGVEAEITIKYADGTVLHFPVVEMAEYRVDYDSEEWIYSDFNIALPKPIAYTTLTFHPKGEYTLTTPEPETKQQKRARLIREMYPQN